MAIALIAVIVSPALIFATAYELEDKKQARNISPNKLRHWMELAN